MKLIKLYKNSKSLFSNVLQISITIFFINYILFNLEASAFSVTSVILAAGFLPFLITDFILKMTKI